MTRLALATLTLALGLPLESMVMETAWGEGTRTCSETIMRNCSQDRCDRLRLSRVMCASAPTVWIHGYGAHAPMANYGFESMVMELGGRAQEHTLVGVELSN